MQLYQVFLITFLGSFTLTVTSWAQDAGMSDVEIVDESYVVDNEKMLYAPGEAEVRYIPKAASPVMKDSSAVQVMEARAPEAVTGAAKKQPTKQEDESILTFNFLYYIIQKYKLQDIID